MRGNWSAYTASQSTSATSSSSVNGFGTASRTVMTVYTRRSRDCHSRPEDISWRVLQRDRWLERVPRPADVIASAVRYGPKAAARSIDRQEHVMGKDRTTRDYIRPGTEERGRLREDFKFNDADGNEQLTLSEFMRFMAELDPDMSEE